MVDAHFGVGLGHKFFIHIERCKILLRFIEIIHDDVISSYDRTHNKLKLHNDNLIKNEEIVILNKCNLLQETEILKKRNYLVNFLNKEILCLSVNDDLQSILRLLSEKLKKSDSKKTTNVYDL